MRIAGALISMMAREAQNELHRRPALHLMQEPRPPPQIDRAEKPFLRNARRDNYIRVQTPA